MTSKVKDSSSIYEIFHESYSQFFIGSSDDIENFSVTQLKRCLQEDKFNVFRFELPEEKWNKIHTGIEDLDSNPQNGFWRKIENKIKEKTDKIFEILERKIICFPLGRDDFGVLILDRNISKDLIMGLELICNSWTQGHKMSDLHARNSQLVDELGRNLHNLSVVRSISQLATKAQDIDHLLKLILNVAATTFNASICAILLENEKTGKLELRESQGFPDDFDENTSDTKINDLIVENLHQRVFDCREPILLKNVMLPKIETDVRKVDASVMCVPLVMRRNVFGVIYIASQEKTRPFDKEDLNILFILSSHASAVLDQARLFTLASTDELTGLLTRRYYMQRIGEEYKRCVRYQHHLSLIVIDIDLFKKVNDTHGHSAGDMVLKEVANAIRAEIRIEVDAAVRFGGEEFVVILPETHLRGAFRVAERIREAVEGRLIEYDGQNIPITASLGLSAYPENGAAIEDLFNLADNALYRSKKSGRNCVTTIPFL